MNILSIFYADDDEDDLMLFAEAVEMVTKNFNQIINLYIHRNGENLLNNIKKIKPQNGVAFLDINMPRKSGFQFLKEIRSEPGIEKFPVVIYSTASDESDINLSFKLDANFFATKPHNFNDLKKMISDVIAINWKEHQVDSTNFMLIK